MTIIYHPEVEQGSEAWGEMRRGLLTASEMRHIITPAKLLYASNDKERGHLYELAAQRVTGYVEPSYISDAMLRGMGDEIHAKAKYAEKYAPVENCGFITNDRWGFAIGYSPDSLVGSAGLIECKSRCQKIQFETIISDSIPTENVIQLQTELLVSEREWVDYVSYCGGMPLYVKRVFPDKTIQDAIVAASTTFHEKLERIIKEYGEKIVGLIPTERVIEQEILV